MKGKERSVGKASHRDLFQDLRVEGGDATLLRLVSGFKYNFVPLRAAAAEMGLTPEVVLEAGYRRQIFFIFPRPQAVQVRPATADLAKYGELPLFAPEFFVLPVDACFSLIFRQETEVSSATRALNFIDSRGLSVAPWSTPAIKIQDIASGETQRNMERTSGVPWALWAFFREGKLASVPIGRADLYVLREELTLTAPRLREAAIREQEAYRSDRLEMLKEAARIFWGDAGVDPQLPETFPRTKEIEQWFLDRNFPSSLVEHATRLIRPNYAPRGRPRTSTRKK